jgi:hypothetical protein
MIEPDFDAGLREKQRPEREKELIGAIRTLKYLKQDYARYTIKAEEALVDASRAKEDLEAQDKLVRGLIEVL